MIFFIYSFFSNFNIIYKYRYISMVVLYKGFEIFISDKKDINLFKKYEETLQSARHNTPIILTMEWIKREVPDDFINLLVDEQPETILLSWRNYNKKMKKNEK